MTPGVFFCPDPHKSHEDASFPPRFCGIYACRASRPACPNTRRFAVSRKDLLLRPVNASNKTGAPIVAFTRAVVEVHDVEDRGDGYGDVAECFHGKPFVPKGEKYQILQADKDATKDWKIDPAGDGVFKISDPKSGMVLTVVDDEHRARTMAR